MVLSYAHFLILTLRKDFARLLPPEYPVPRYSQCFGRLAVLTHFRTKSFLYRLLRPEFLMNYPTELSSDACSLFGYGMGILCTPNFRIFWYYLYAKESNEEVKEATLFLRQTLVPQLAEELSSMLIAKNNVELENQGEFLLFFCDSCLTNVRFWFLKIDLPWKGS